MRREWQEYGWMWLDVMGAVFLRGRSLLASLFHGIAFVGFCPSESKLLWQICHTQGKRGQ